MYLVLLHKLLPQETELQCNFSRNGEPVSKDLRNWPTV